VKISLITATFNSVKTIATTIDSVRSQNIDNLEYIIIDGGSSDGTPDIINQYKDVVSKVICEPDKGIYDALNKGIKIASGEIIGFLHSDDIFADNQVLEEVISTFEKDSVDLLYGDLQYVTTGIPPKILRHWKSGTFCRSNLKKGWMPPHPTVYFKRELIEKIGDFNLSYSISADYDWIVRCLTLPEIKVEYLPKLMIKMKTGGKSNSSLKNIIKKSKEDMLKVRNLGSKSLDEIIFKLEGLGLAFRPDEEGGIL